jgi:cytoskeletal protein CcmA (bactofilin family)
MAASPTTPPPPILPVRTAPSAAPPAPAPLEGEMWDTGAGRHETLRVRDWRVRGAAKVVGDAEVGFAVLAGSVTVGGSFRAADVTSRGQLTVNGTTRIEGPLRLDGYSEFSSEVRAQEMTSTGYLGVSADVIVPGRVTLRGRAEILGGLTAGTVSLGGTLVAGGPVTVDRLEGELTGESKTGPIRANTVEFRAARFPPWKAPGTLTTLRIEATEVRLEGVTVEFLKADRIELGPHCRVARVEGRVVQRHRSASVGPFATGWIHPGLTR